VLWLRRTISGTPVVLEAQGPSYQDFGRISMLTGLPTVLGWDYHVKQRGNPETEIEARRQAVRAVYANPDAARIEGILRRYRVGYVYVGWLEKKTYPPEGLQKFQTDRSRFQLVYENPETRIYRVAGGPGQDVVIPARESLPENAAPAQPQDEPQEKPSILEHPAAAESPYADLKEPRGAAVDDRGRLWVADFGHSRLRIFDANGGYLGGWGGRGSGEFGFRELCDVAIRGEDLYVADTWNGRVQAFTIGGVLRASAGDLYGPRGVAVAPDRRVWVSDTGNHRVVSYDALLQDRRIVGGRGDKPGQFSSPVGIAVSPSGAVYVADTGNRRIQVLGPGGEVRESLAFPGWGENAEPQLAVDEDGTIYASDPASGTVVSLDAGGRLIKRLAADEAGRRFEKPTGLALDPKNRILYVINSGNSSVSRVRLGASPAERRKP
jgi:sugar lactone lactonase YvrE